MPPKILLLDANVLIDFMQSDPNLLSLVSSHIGSIHVLDKIVSEVTGLDERDCKKYGLTVIEPTEETIAFAEIKMHKLSYNDRLCLFTAIESDYICVTNDKDLRLACEEYQIKILWGLELIRMLVEKRVLKSEYAIKVVENIHKTNRLYIPRNLVEKFKRLVREIDQ